jgi:uncharacterized protein (TIGR02271 family)
MADKREDVLSWRGQTLIDNDGDKVGKVEEIYLDQQTSEPEWAVVTTGLFGTKQTFIPIHDATATGDGVQVPFAKSQIQDAPRIDPDGALSHEEEGELYRHYGRDHSDTTTGRTESDFVGDEGGPGHDTSGPNTDDAMTRSEEELRIGTTERETGRVRLRKYVVEDEVTKTVPVRREEIRVEREPITEANADDALDGPALSEEEHEVVLHEEEVVVGKQAVPKERIRLEKDVETSEAAIDETVRSERIEVEDSRH